MSNDASLDINQKSNPVQTVAPTKEDNNMTRATDKITALYCRLSVEDTKEKGGKDDPSNSIQHQQIMLMEYAKSQHFPNPTFFIDDGYSGVDFSNRPGFQKMLAEIEAGHVEVVITKDLSRLGRNSSLTGLYINYTFPQYGVRYIAINDHFDTIDPNSTDSDMAGIKNWFNEWYAKDTSRKIRAVNKAKGERGERLTTNVPYGYKRDSDDPKKWVIDEEAAQVVKRIFALCMEGKGPSQIAALLEKEKVLNPTAYKQREGQKTPHQAPENEYRWHESTVAYILEYMEYTGCTVNFKTYTNSIWDKKQRENPMENRKIFYNTHPASSLWKSLIRCRRSGSSGTAEQRRERAICSSVWCSAMTASRSSTTPPPAILKSGRTSSSAPPIVPIRTSSADIISVLSCWNNSSGSTSKRSYRWSLAMRHISVRKWSKSSAYRARNRCGCLRSGWHRLRSGLESLTVFSSAFTRTM